MKKLITLLLALILGVTLLAGCGGGANEASNDGAQIGEGPIVDMTFDELDAALEGYGLDRDATTYEDVAAFLGVYGVVDEDWSDSIMAVSWYASDEGFATVFFDKETGFYSSWSTSGFGRPA